MTYKPVADQMAVFQRILSLADGYFNECSRTWSPTGQSAKLREAHGSVTTMASPSWLAANKRSFSRISAWGRRGTQPGPDGLRLGVLQPDAEGGWQFFAK